MSTPLASSVGAARLLRLPKCGAPGYGYAVPTARTLLFSVFVLGACPQWLGACAQWPRYDNLPVDTAERLVAGSQVGPSWDVAWTEASPLSEPLNDDPRALPAETIGLDEGVQLSSALLGSGWVYGTPPARTEECGHTSAFPPKEDGYYLADVDWRVVEVEDVGLLCSSFYADQAGGQVDVVPFEVDECGLPVSAVFAPGGGDLPLGFGVSGTENVWSIAVSAPVRYAIAAAGWAPNDETAELPYHWAVSFLSATEGGGAGVSCPPPPDAVAL